MIYHGNKQVKSLYLGDTRIVGLYKGDEMILSSECVISVDAPHTTLTEGTVVNYGSPYTASIAAESGYALINVTVTMDGEVISAYSDGVINIPRVTGLVMITALTSQIIIFEDSAVKNLCVSNFGGNYESDEISEYEAAQVSSLGTVFKNNISIVKFNELLYFTGLTTLDSAFDGCTALAEITFPTTSHVTGSLGTAFRNIAVEELDLSPLAGSSVIVPNNCFVMPYLTTLVTTGVAINGYGDDRIMSMPSLVDVIGGLTGWNRSIDLSGSTLLSKSSVIAIINSLGEAEGKTITLAATVKCLVTGADCLAANSKGWYGLWNDIWVNGHQFKYGLLTPSADTTIGFNVCDNITPTVYSDGVDVTDTDYSNGHILCRSSAETRIAMQVNSLAGTMTFSGTTTQGLILDSRVFFVASEAGWYKASVTIGAGTTKMNNTAKNAALRIRRYSGNMVNYDGVVAPEDWALLNNESFAVGKVVEGYGYLGEGDMLMTLDTLDGTGTYSVEKVSAITLPDGYELAQGLPLDLNRVDIPDVPRSTLSVSIRLKVNNDDASQMWLADNTAAGTKKHRMGRLGGNGYGINTYWGGSYGRPPTATMVNSTYLNNIVQYDASSASYTFRRITNGTIYSANYSSSSESASTSDHFSLLKCIPYYLRFVEGGQLIRGYIPVVDSEGKYRLYDHVEQEFCDIVKVLNMGFGSGLGSGLNDTNEDDGYDEMI